MKTNAIVRIILFSLAILILLGILLGVLCFRMLRFDNLVTIRENDIPEPTAGQMGQLEFSPDIKRIEIEWVAGNIMIDSRPLVENIIVTESMGNDVTETMFCTTSGNTLKIKFCEKSMKFSSFGINSTITKDLHIVVPATWNCDELSIDAAASDVSINALTINDMDFDGASGNLGLYDCNLWNLDIDTASGDVEFNGTLENLDFGAASASFHGTIHNCPSQIQIDSMSGKLDLNLPVDCGFTLTNDSLSGRFNSDFEICARNDTLVHGNGSCKIDISGLSGDVSIKKHAAAFETSPTQDCNVPNCTESSHDHSTIYLDENCTNTSHNHGDNCQDINCTDTTHNHQPNHNNTEDHQSNKKHH